MPKQPGKPEPRKRSPFVDRTVKVSGPAGRERPLYGSDAEVVFLPFDLHDYHTVKHVQLEIAPMAITKADYVFTTRHLVHQVFGASATVREAIGRKFGLGAVAGAVAESIGAYEFVPIVHAADVDEITRERDDDDDATEALFAATVRQFEHALGALRSTNETMGKIERILSDADTEGT